MVYEGDLWKNGASTCAGIEAKQTRPKAIIMYDSIFSRSATAIAMPTIPGPSLLALPRVHPSFEEQSDGDGDGDTEDRYNHAVASHQRPSIA